MLARLERRAHNLRMRVVRRGDNHCVNILARKNLAIVPHVVFAVGVADGCDLHFGDQSESGNVYALRGSASADYSNLHDELCIITG